MPIKKPSNPFYSLVVVAGLVFALTACGYGVLTVKMLQPQGAAEVRESSGGMLRFLDRHGITLFLSELAVLAVLTFAAIGTDEYWQRRHAATQSQLEREPLDDDQPR